MKRMKNVPKWNQVLATFECLASIVLVRDCMLLIFLVYFFWSELNPILLDSFNDQRACLIVVLPKTIVAVVMKVAHLKNVQHFTKISEFGGIIFSRRTKLICKAILIPDRRKNYDNCSLHLLV